MSLSLRGLKPMNVSEAAAKFLSELEAERTRIDKLIGAIRETINQPSSGSDRESVRPVTNAQPSSANIYASGSTRPVITRKAGANNGITARIEEILFNSDSGANNREIVEILMAENFPFHGSTPPSASVAQVLSRLVLKGRATKDDETRRYKAKR